MKKVSQETKEKIFQLYLSGLPMIQIAKEYNVCVKTINKYVKELNLQRSRIHYSIENINKAIELYIMGERVHDIIDQTGVPESRLYKELKNKGISERRTKKCSEIDEKIDREKVFELYNSNMLVTDIAKEMGNSESSIVEIIKTGLENGVIQMSEIYLKNKQENEICDMLAQIIVMQQKNHEIKIRHVADLFGVEEQKLYYRVAEAKKEMSGK